MKQKKCEQLKYANNNGMLGTVARASDSWTVVGWSVGSAFAIVFAQDVGARRAAGCTRVHGPQKIQKRYFIESVERVGALCTVIDAVANWDSFHIFRYSQMLILACESISMLFSGRVNFISRINENKFHDFPILNDSAHVEFLLHCPLSFYPPRLFMNYIVCFQINSYNYVNTTST